MRSFSWLAVAGVLTAGLAGHAADSGSPGASAFNPCEGAACNRAEQRLRTTTEPMACNRACTDNGSLTTFAEETQCGYQACCELGSDARVYFHVDAKTYRGWQSFEAFCAGCHGRDARGGGPPRQLDLIARLSQQSCSTDTLNTFRRDVLAGANGNTGSRTDAGTVPEGSGAVAGKHNMPAWERNRHVRRDVDSIYRYLVARAKGDLEFQQHQRLRHIAALEDS